MVICFLTDFSPMNVHHGLWQLECLHMLASFKVLPYRICLWMLFVPQMCILDQSNSNFCSCWCRRRVQLIAVWCIYSWHSNWLTIFMAWFRNASDLTTLSTTYIVPVDLNSFILKVIYQLIPYEWCSGKLFSLNLASKFYGRCPDGTWHSLFGKCYWRE